MLESIGARHLGQAADIAEVVAIAIEDRIDRGRRRGGPCSLRRSTGELQPMVQGGGTCRNVVGAGPGQRHAGR